MLYVFFFKQKTAYEMRISDWSSDVVLFRSFDLRGHDRGVADRGLGIIPLGDAALAYMDAGAAIGPRFQIGIVPHVAAAQDGSGDAAISGDIGTKLREQIAVLALR